MSSDYSDDESSPGRSGSRDGVLVIDQAKTTRAKNETSPTKVFVDKIVNSIENETELRQDLFTNMEQKVKLPSIYKMNLKKLHKQRMG